MRVVEPCEEVLSPHITPCEEVDSAGAELGVGQFSGLWLEV